MFRVLIASENKAQVNDLKGFLDNSCITEACGSGKWALELFHVFMPDIIVVDDRLPDMDAFSLIRTVRSTGGKFCVVLLTTLLDPVVESQCKALGVSAVFLKPCRTSRLASQIQNLAVWLRDPNNPVWTLEDEANIILSDLSFGMGLEKRYIILQAILLRYAGPYNMQMKHVYLEIAKQNKSTYDQVEKAVRDAILTAWKKGDPQIWDMYFRPKWNGERRHPSNEEFIARMVYSLQYRQRQKLPLEQIKIG